MGAGLSAARSRRAARARACASCGVVGRVPGRGGHSLQRRAPHRASCLCARFPPHGARAASAAGLAPAARGADRREHGRRRVRAALAAGAAGPTRAGGAGLARRLARHAGHWPRLLVHLRLPVRPEPHGVALIRGGARGAARPKGAARSAGAGCGLGGKGEGEGRGRRRGGSEQGAPCATLFRLARGGLSRGGAPNLEDAAGAGWARAAPGPWGLSLPRQAARVCLRRRS